MQEPSSHCKISTEKLENEFLCTVCLSPIEDCYITRCGHVYCRPCIQETVNRHHRCPFCTTQLKEFSADVFKNYHFNALKKIVDDERALQNKHYLSRVFQLPQVELPENSSQNVDLMGPVEEVILKHFKSSLLLYRTHVERIFQSLRAVEEKKLLLGLPAIENKDIIKQIHNSLLPSIPSPVISPEILTHATPIQVILPSKKNHKSILHLSMQSPLASLLPHLDTICSEMNVRLKGPFPSHLKVNGEVMALEEPLLLQVGRKLVVSGLPFEETVYCYSYKWQKSKVTDFYFCKTCEVKWICNVCIEACHNDHDVLIQLKQHQADWACCYCVTKCQCKAINKNSPP